MISGLGATGGGDDAELYYSGVNAALEVSEDDSILLTFTDAPAKDAYLRNQVLNQARERNIRVFSFYVGFSIGKRRKRQFFETETEPDVLDGSDENDFATASGGFTIGIRPGDANATAKFVTRRLRNLQPILTINLQAPSNLTFAVDKAATLLHIDVSSATTISNYIEIIDPTGRVISATPDAASSFFQLYSIPNPAVGLWSIRSPHQNPHNIEVSINSSISCLTTLSTSSLREESAEYLPLPNSPTVNQADLYILTLCENINETILNASIILIDKLGKTIATLPSSSIGKNGFIALAQIPAVSFRMLAIIDLNDSTHVQRQDTELISPTLINIEITNQPYVLIGNGSVNMTFTIYNWAPSSLNITLCVVDTLKLVNESQRCSLSYYIDSNKTRNDQILVTNSLYASLENETSSTFTFTISADVFNGTMTNKITSNNKMVLYLTRAAYRELPVPETSSTSIQSTSSTPSATQAPLEQIVLVPLC